MTGSKRREELINTIKSSTSPISGKTLAQLYDVSRQVIVQDIALLRTAGYDIISTNRGYILNAPHTITRVFKVSHTDAQTEDELLDSIKNIDTQFDKQRVIDFKEKFMGSCDGHATERIIELMKES